MQDPRHFFCPSFFCLLWLVLLPERRTTPLQAQLRGDGARVCRRPLAWVLGALGSGRGE